MKDNKLGVNLDGIIKIIKASKTDIRQNFCCEKKCLSEAENEVTLKPSVKQSNLKKRKKVKQRQPVNTSKSSKNEVTLNAGISSNTVSQNPLNFNGIQNTIQNDTARINNDIAKYELQKLNEFRNNQFIKPNVNRFSNEFIPQITPLRYNDNTFRRMGDNNFEEVEGIGLPQYNNLEPEYRQYNVTGYAVEEDDNKGEKQLSDFGSYEVDAFDENEKNNIPNKSSTFVSRDTGVGFVEPKKIKNKIVKPKQKFDFDIIGDEDPVNTNETKRSALETKQDEDRRIALEKQEDEDRQISIRKINKEPVNLKIPVMNMKKTLLKRHLIEGIISYTDLRDRLKSYDNMSVKDLRKIYLELPFEQRKEFEENLIKRG